MAESRTNKGEYYKFRQIHAKAADLSLFKYDILMQTKQAIVYELNDQPYICLVKTNDDGSNQPKK